MVTAQAVGESPAPATAIIIAQKALDRGNVAARLRSTYPLAQTRSANPSTAAAFRWGSHGTGSLPKHRGSDLDHVSAMVRNWTGLFGSLANGAYKNEKLKSVVL